MRNTNSNLIYILTIFPLLFLSQDVFAYKESDLSQLKKYLRCKKCDLSNANLRGANLRGAILIDADLNSSDLRDANLSGANLSGANLKKANLSGSVLRSANLTNANLSGANLSGANLIRVNLSKVNLSGANLKKSNLRGAKLMDSNLSNANVSNADLSGAKLTGTNTSDAIFEGVKGNPSLVEKYKEEKQKKLLTNQEKKQELGKNKEQELQKKEEELSTNEIVQKKENKSDTKKVAKKAKLKKQRPKQPVTGGSGVVDGYKDFKFGMTNDQIKATGMCESFNKNYFDIYEVSLLGKNCYKIAGEKRGFTFIFTDKDHVDLNRIVIGYLGVSTKTYFNKLAKGIGKKYKETYRLTREQQFKLNDGHMKVFFAGNRIQLYEMKLSKDSEVPIIRLEYTREVSPSYEFYAPKKVSTDDF